ncbi:hypothetical protein BFX36_15485 [Acinetobacter baumannii]|nr:hypothetical protein BFX36_15485 [Acinetobacter baumannii]
MLPFEPIQWLKEAKLGAVRIPRKYGGDGYVQMAIQRLIGFGKKEEFKEILAILRRQNPDRIRVL